MPQPSQPQPGQMLRLAEAFSCHPASAGPSQNVPGTAVDTCAPSLAGVSIDLSYMSPESTIQHQLARYRAAIWH